MTDLYGILGVEPDATPDEIKSAWRLLARENHPDRGGDAGEFAVIADAYKILSDSDKRTAYDVRFHLSKHVVCRCGRAKVPASRLCTWCALAEVQDLHAVKKAEKKRERVRKRRHTLNRLKSAAGSAIRSEAGRARQDGQQRSIPRPDLGLPSADDLLGAVLAESAMRSGLLDAGLNIDVRVQLDPLTGDVQLTGKSVNAYKKIHGNLTRMQNIMRHLTGIDSSQD